MSKFQVGDVVRLMEPFRSNRLKKDKGDKVAGADQTVARVSGPYIYFGGSAATWVADCFEHAGGPW